MEDADLFRLMKSELFTAVVGDVLDAAGYRLQFLPPELRPLDPDMVACGRAMTVLEADCFDTADVQAGGQRAFGLMFEALDDLMPGEVYICTGASPRYALWGELMSTRATKLGAVGAVVDGYSRDTRAVRQMKFPTFSHGCYGQDQGPRGRVIDFRCRLGFPNGASVEPGDIVFGDVDGVVIIPRAVERDIVEKALEKVRGENKVKKAIEEGMGAREAWDTFGIM